jgi:hypothetical protein
VGEEGLEAPSLNLSDLYNEKLTERELSGAFPNKRGDISEIEDKSEGEKDEAGDGNKTDDGDGDGKEKYDGDETQVSLFKEETKGEEKSSKTTL